MVAAGSTMSGSHRTKSHISNGVSVHSSVRGGSVPECAESLKSGNRCLSSAKNGSCSINGSASVYSKNSNLSKLSSKAGSVKTPIPPSSRKDSASTKSLKSSSRVSSTGKSISSTQALGMLNQLEELLEREREARQAAELTLRTLVSSKQNQAADSTQKYETVMKTLKGIISETIPAAGSNTINKRRGSHTSTTSSKQLHRATAARSGFTMDHKGGLHFAVSREGSERSACLPPLSR